MRWVWGRVKGTRLAVQVGCVHRQAVAGAGEWWQLKPGRSWRLVEGR